MVTAVTARAPASVGNVAVGFDILGHALDAPGDRVRASRNAQPGVRIQSISGTIQDCESLPRDPAANTAGRALLAFLEHTGADFGLDVDIEKGIPLLAGMGGSGASAVAAVVAANGLLDQPLTESVLMRLAAVGESAASGEPHADDVAASLLGGLVLVADDELIRLPVPDRLHCALVRPHHTVATREARQILRSPYELPAVTRQSANLAAFVSACYENDVNRLGRVLRDVMVEPRRAVLVPGFEAVQQAAMDAGALGCSLSGAGASLFAWCRSESGARDCAGTMAAAFARQGLEADQWVSPVDARGAEIISSA